MAPSRGRCASALDAIAAALDPPPPAPGPVQTTVRRVAAALLLGLLLSRAGRLCGRRRRRGPPSVRGSRAWAAEPGAAKARADQPAQGVRHLRFKQTVTCCVVPNLCFLTDEKKAKLWWHQTDFASFLKTRVEIGRAYYLVAKRRGVAVGSSFPPEPALAHESRRGLGLGRKKQRDRNRQRYIKAVLDEQSRQRRERLANIEVIERAGAHGDSGWVLDAQRLSQAALPCSESDRRYAVAQAREDYENTLQDPDPEPGDGSWKDDPSNPKTMRARAMSISLDDVEQLGQPLPFDFSLSDDDGESRGSFWGVAEEEMERYVSPSVSSSKGFGLSRDELEQAGLSATGNLVRRRSAEEDCEWSASEVSQSDNGASDMSDGGADWD